MAAKEEYEVLRLIEHNQICYISSGCVSGTPLPGWIKYHPCVDKGELFRIIGEIAKQLSQIHRCRGNPCYRYVNPYSVIVSEDGQIHFLDVDAQSSGGQLRIMQRRMVREHFLPPEEPYYQKASVELDIYGFGRTVQYLLAETEVWPALGRREEAKFQKIISRCLGGHSKNKKAFQNVSEIQKMIPEYKKSKEKVKKENRLRRIVVTALLSGGLAVSVIGGGCAIVRRISPADEQQKQPAQASQSQGQKSGKQPVQSGQPQGQESVQAGQSQGQKSGQQQLQSGQPQGQKSGQELQEKAAGSNEDRFEKDGIRQKDQGSFPDNKTENRLNMELGAIYFLELCNYEKSREYFANAEGNALAEYMTVVADYFAENVRTDGDVHRESARAGAAQERDIQVEVVQERETQEEAVQEKNILAENAQEKAVRDERLRQALEAAKAETEEQDEESIGEKLCFYQCILKGYTVLKENTDFRNVIRLGKLCLQDGGTERMPEILGYMAQAYEGLGKPEKAARMYEEQLKCEKD